MKRLTTRTSMDGKAKLIVADGTLSDKLIEQFAIQRLAEYEDTGLKPKEINEKMNEAYDLGAQSVLRYKGLTWSEAEELLRYRDAEEQGLLVWLPCKEGTWVYKVCMISVRDDDYAMTWHQEMGIREVRFQASMRDQFGKTVFLTREEAEKALEDA